MKFKSLGQDSFKRARVKQSDTQDLIFWLIPTFRGWKEKGELAASNVYRKPRKEQVNQKLSEESISRKTWSVVLNQRDWVRRGLKITYYIS